MSVLPLVDHGQLLAPPAGKVIGFVDSPGGSEAFAQAVRAAGYAESQLTLLHGESGLRLLQRLQGNSVYFGDSEDEVIQLGIRQLQKGHYAVLVEVANHQQAVEIARLAAPHGGHSFSYFGTWVSERLSK